MAQKTWTRIRPLFEKEFATTSDDKLIINDLANLAHRHGENPRKFFSRLEKLFNILHENYASYRIKPDRLAQCLAGNYSEDALTQYVNDSVETYNKFLFAQVLKLQLQKMFANCFHTRIKPGSPLTTPTKPSSQNTELNRTNDKLQPSMSMPWRIIRLTMQLSRTRMWLLSVRNGRNSNNNSANNNKQGLTTVAIAPEVKTTTEATTTDNLRNPKAPMLPEMVNSVSTAKS
jgi:hypothetical protein